MDKISGQRVRQCGSAGGVASQSYGFFAATRPACNHAVSTFLIGGRGLELSVLHTNVLRVGVTTHVFTPMSKQINVCNRITTVLDRIREDEGVSYSGAIEKLINTSADDLALNEINKRFFELESLMPDLHSTWETLRIIAIHVRKLPIDVRQVHINKIDDRLADIVSDIMELKREGVDPND